MKTTEIPANVKLWLEEGLESGEFKQTKGTLEDDTGLFCLGAACIVAESHGVELQKNTQYF